MISDTIKFLSELEQNNNKQWFDINRERYQELRDWFKEFVRELINQIAHFDNDIGFLEPKNCIYRINRDIRFSNNKQPYKTQFSASFEPGGDKQNPRPGYYFQIDYQGNLLVGGGSYAIAPKTLLKIRKEIAKDSYELREIINNKSFKKTYGGLHGDQLKTSPRGFDKDHPDIDLLRYKNFTPYYQKSITNFDEKKIQKYIIKGFQTVQPLIEWLRKVEK